VNSIDNYEWQLTSSFFVFVSMSFLSTGAADSLKLKMNLMLMDTRQQITWKKNFHTDACIVTKFTKYKYF